MLATIFKNNQSQAVRIPKKLAFPDNVKQVEIIKEGNKLVLIPKENVWDSWFAEYTLPEDFMPEREQPPMQERKDF